MAKSEYANKLQLFINDEQLAALDDLVERGGFRSRAELLDNALTLMEWSLERVKEGYFIAAVDVDESIHQRIVMPVFIRSAHK